MMSMLSILLKDTTSSTPDDSIDFDPTGTKNGKKQDSALL